MSKTLALICDLNIEIKNFAAAKVTIKDIEHI